MIGILIILAVSWGLLHIFSSENLSVLGPTPLLKRLAQFGIGLLFAMLLNGAIIFSEAGLRGSQWQLSESFSVVEIISAFYYHLKSALTEDLLFRGALLYILITKMKPWVGMLISGIAFGVYHWFSYGILNHGVVVLVYVFVITGLTGFVWAYAFHKTKSIALGLGLHTGWNLTTSFLLIAQPFGTVLFSASDGTTFNDASETWIAIIKGLLPSVIMFLYIRTRHKKTETDY